MTGRFSLERAVANDTKVIRAAHPVMFPLLERLHAPAMRVPGVGVLVQDTALVREALTDTERFTKNGPGASSELWTPVLGESVLLNMHGDAHRQLRQKLQPLFAPKFVRAMVQDRAQPRWQTVADELCRGATVDVAQLTRETASDAIATIVGLDREVVTDEMFHQVAEITGMVKVTSPTLSERQITRAKALLAQLTEAAHAAYDGDESTLPGRMRAMGLSKREALGAVGAFVLTGTETLASAIPRIVALMVDSGWSGRIAHGSDHRDADAELQGFLAESLRWTTPSLATLRSALCDTTLGPVQVRRGDRLVIATYKANRQMGGFDPASNRAVALKQLWFGAGAHFCIGAPLAMAQMTTVLTELREVIRAGHPLEILSRTPARRTLIPAYQRLEVRAQ